MGSVTGNTTTSATVNTSLATTFDAAGRLSQETYECDTSGDGCTGAANYAVGHNYDQVDHTTQVDMSTFVYPGTAYYDWGPNNHPIRIGQTPVGSTSPAYETLHWDGNQLLFTTNSNGNLDDVKIGTIGDITPRDSVYTGLTFWDRDQSSSLVYCHNASGAAGNGVPNPKVYYGRLTGIPHYVNPCSIGPASMVWWATPNNTYRIGTNGLLAMPRGDGFTDGFNTIQGVRSYDAGIGSWTTADGDSGVLDDPMSQKSYVWNRSNAVGYSDASGYDSSLTWDANAQSGGAITDPMSKHDVEDDTIAVVHKDGSVSTSTLVGISTADASLIASGASYGYSTGQVAAWAASLKYLVTANNSQVEYGTPIYELAGKYGYGGLTIGDTAVVNVDTTKKPKGSLLVGIWHNHPFRNDGLDHTADLQKFRDDNPKTAFTFWTSAGGSFARQDIDAKGNISPYTVICTHCVPNPLLEAPL